MNDLPAPGQGVPAIEVLELHKSFGRHEVLKGIDFVVEPGEVVCVIGPSGSGKSTLLRCINRLEEPTSGQVRVEGVNICDLGTRVIGDADRPVYAMVLEVSLPPGADPDALAVRLGEVADRLGVDASLHTSDADIL